MGRISLVLRSRCLLSGYVRRLRKSRSTDLSVCFIVYKELLNVLEPRRYELAQHAKKNACLAISNQIRFPIGEGRVTCPWSKLANSLMKKLELSTGT